MYKLFYHMHPEAALRYLPIVRYLKSKNLNNASILEVGSGAFGLAPYLNRLIDGVDVNFEEGLDPRLRQIFGSAEHLPMKDSTYDVLILSDVLEHVPPKARQACLSECIRVAKKEVIVAGPFGEAAFAQDKMLANYSKRKIKNMHHFFVEHLENGLPEIADIDKYIGKNKKVHSVEILGNYLNLKARELLMKIYITNNKLQYYFYLKGMMLFIPIFSRLNRNPCYRTLISIHLQHE